MSSENLFTQAYEEAFNDGVKAAANFVLEHVPNLNKAGTLIREPNHGKQDSSRQAYYNGIMTLVYEETK